MEQDNQYSIKADLINALRLLSILGICALVAIRGTALLAQCPTTINTFPHTEGFEAGPAWTAGGTASDWEWGTPSHPLINTAAEGTKGWFVGTLGGTFYADGQQSWLESPCFDFTSLIFPHISFKLFWECERQYDGLGFQYSLDQGGSWSNVGSFNGPNDCMNQNWFNTQSITTLYQASPKAGWSGRVGPTAGSCAGGMGSGTWVTASQCLDDLQGEPSVKFRFIFGAGTQCNNFDGIGVDLVQIGEAPPNQAAFNFQCNGSTVDFQDSSTPCPSSHAWDFGDPGSGVNNTSMLAAPSHAYSAPGTYQVSLTISGPCNATNTVVLPVTITSVAVQTTDAGCTQDQGTATAVVTGSGPFTYAWTPGGQSTQTITGLSAGEVSVAVSGASVCPVQAIGTVLPGAAGPSITISKTDITCNGNDDGIATAVVSGGAGPFSYSWSPTGGSAPTAIGLGPGTYTLTVSDGSACNATADVTIIEPPLVTVTPQAALVLCAGAAVDLTATAAGGVPGYTYLWSPNGPSVAPTQNTTYAVVATDANGCTSSSAQVEITVGASIDAEFAIADSTGCAPFCIELTDQSMSAGTRSWDLGDGSDPLDGSTISHCYTDAGLFSITLTITDANGCDGSLMLEDVIRVLAVPTAAFTPYPAVTTIDRPTFTFIDGSSDATFWAWHFGNVGDSTSIANSPAFTYEEIGCYTVQLEVANALGCAASTETEVCVEEEFQLFAPNTFTPNNDLINDGFKVISSVIDPSYFELLIFDRWGQIIFTTVDINQAWSGNDLPQGIYTWQLRMHDVYGGLQQRRGHVSLVR